MQTFARPWAIPGTPGLEHRIGGLEKDAITGDVSYDPNNHQLMTDTRAWKVANIANDIPDLSVDGDEELSCVQLGDEDLVVRSENVSEVPRHRVEIPNMEGGNFAAVQAGASCAGANDPEC